MKRRPEPELMDQPAQARAYAEADFSEPHDAFVTQFRERFPGHQPRRVLDLGCGPADISCRFAQAYPDCRVLGIDGAAAMLALGEQRLQQSRLQHRVSLQLCHLPAPDLATQGPFDTIICNSLLHHLHDPLTLWQTICQAAAADCAVLIMDLLRPDSERQAAELVRLHAGDEADLLQHDFYHSLLAAYRPQEVATQIQYSGLQLAVHPISDRHMIMVGFVRPSP